MNSFVRLIGLSFVVAVIGLWRWVAGDLGWNEGETVVIASRIGERPLLKWDLKRQEEYWWVKLWLDSEMVFIRFPRWPELSLGDHLSIEGNLRALDRDPTVDDGAKNTWFTWKWVLVPLHYEVIPKTHLSWVEAFHENSLRLFRKNSSHDVAGLLAGVVLGYKNDLTPQLVDQLRRTGLTHVVVASGFNALLIAGTVLTISLKFLNRKYALICSLIALWFYTALLNWDLPILRASLMISLAYLGTLWGRLRRPIWNLFTVGLLMLAWQPRWVLELSWWLSMSSTAGILIVEPYLHIFVVSEGGSDFGLRKSVRVIMQTPFVGEHFASTFAAQVAVLPLILYISGELTLTALLSNVLLLSWIPLITIGGMLIALIGDFPFFGPVFLYFLNVVCEIFLQCLFVVSQFTYVISVPWNGLLTGLYYVLLLFLLFNLRRSPCKDTS